MANGSRKTFTDRLQTYYLNNVWEFVEEHKISCSKIYYKLYSTLIKGLEFSSNEIK